jgi:crotonobetainyl-CoA:carnitine CoA-transferase CaiB-like acyl-CoA transferase
MPPFIDGEGAVFRRVNRGKKSVALDLKSPCGQAAMRRIAGRVDVIVEGNRPGVMARLGLNYEALAPANPRLIYVSLTGYGQQGEHACVAGHDINYIAQSGLLDLMGPPVIPGIQLADLAGGTLHTVIGILLALSAREKTGRGQFVDISMCDGLGALLHVPLALLEATGQTPESGNTTLTGRYACYNLYRAKDGRWLAVGALEPKFWSAFCRVLGREHLIADQFAEGPRQEEIKRAVAEIFATRDAVDWMAAFKGTDSCVSSVLTVAEAGELRPMPWLASTPPEPCTAVPKLGEHTREVLAASGLTEDEIHALGLI